MMNNSGCNIYLLLLGFDYLIYDCVSKTLSAEELKGILHQILVRTHNYGFNVSAVIADGASTNRALSKEVFCHSNPHDDPDDVGINTHMLHPMTGRPVYWIPDPSHVIKKFVASLGNSNHLIFMKDPSRPADEEATVQINLDAMHALFRSFEGRGGSLCMFRFNRNDFVKTNFEKMNVGPCLKVTGPKMMAMGKEANRRQDLFDAGDEMYKKWRNIKHLTYGLLSICENITSVFQVLNRRKMPGLSIKPSHAAELAIFKSVALW